jgi:hypothetical protein
MNELTWIILLVHYVPLISSIVLNIGALTLILLGVWGFSTIMDKSMSYDESFNIVPLHLSGKTFLKLSSYTILIMILFSLVPSKELILLVVGSEYGEDLLMSPQGQQIVGDIKEILNYQLENLKGTIND